MKENSTNKARVIKLGVHVLHGVGAKFILKGNNFASQVIPF